MNTTADKRRRCPLGYFQESTNATSCEEVTAGHQTPTAAEGASQQIECPPGMFSRDGATACEDCLVVLSTRLWKGILRLSGKNDRVQWLRICSKIRPSDEHVAVLSLRREGNAVILAWTETEEVDHSQIVYSIRTSGNDTVNASTVQIDKTSARASGLLYGLKYYFSILAKLKKESLFAVSLASDPVTIPCPPFACCGVSNENAHKCGNVTYGVTVDTMGAERDAYRVEGVTFSRCFQTGACIGGIRSDCASAYTGVLCHRCRSGFAGLVSTPVASVIRGL